MRNSIFLAILINICSISVILAVYVCYKSIVATQEDTRKDISNLIIATQADVRKDIATIDGLVRKEIVFNIIDEGNGAIDIENCCDMTLTCGTPLPLKGDDA